jgi:precorrin-3B synthase
VNTSAEPRLEDTTSLRRGWCPGALRPMESGDGLIIRLRVPGGVMTAGTALEIAGMADKFGNGRIEVTSRANLQIRGVREATLGFLQAELARLELIDADPEGEAARNVLASPLAGLDPSALLDIRENVQELDLRLRRDRTLHRLPAKFHFLIDDGGRFSIANESADIAFLAERRGGGVVFSIYLAGQRASSCKIEFLSESAARLATAFLAWREDDESENDVRRMKSFVQRIGVEPILRSAALTKDVRCETRPPRPHSFVLGAHDLGASSVLGVGIPFGRLDALALRRLAEAAEASHGELRLTPWRAIMIVARAIDPALSRTLAQAGFIFDDRSPMRAVSACPGAPACARATTATQADGERLAQAARRAQEIGVGLHVSGCAKGCAYGKKAPLTLVGRDGRYDLVLDGVAGESPILRAIDPAGLDDLINSIADRPASERRVIVQQLSESSL